jgi:hypothetical protein
MRGEDRLQMVLRQVDDEGKARLLPQMMRQHRAARHVAGALDVADLVDAQRARQHRLVDAIAAEGLDGAGQDGAGLGVRRERGVLLEQPERDAIEFQRQRRHQPDRTGTDDEHWLGGPAHGFTPRADRRNRG